jgi:hypothetical protein
MYKFNEIKNLIGKVEVDPSHAGTVQEIEDFSEFKITKATWLAAMGADIIQG